MLVPLTSISQYGATALEPQVIAVNPDTAAHIGVVNYVGKTPVSNLTFI